MKSRRVISKSAPGVVLVVMTHVSSVVERRDVIPQRVGAEVAVEIAPHGMNMVAVVLRVVELDEERRTLNAEVMLLPRRRAAGPGERNLLDARLLEPRRTVRGDVRGHVGDVHV